MAEKNIEKLAELGELCMKIKLEKNLNKVKKALEQEKYNSGHQTYLAIFTEEYNNKVKIFMDNYGVEFPELQKEFEKILPEINKYIGVKVN
jgi:septation ring formation regulator EzrA